MRKPVIPRQLYAEFEALTEDQIREKIRSGEYNANKARVAQQYLSEKAAERADEATAEQIRIGQSATDAAWESAKAAREANALTIIAVIISVIALAFSIASYFSSGPSSH